MILAACCAINASCLGIICNTRGVFVPYVISSLNCSTTAFTSYTAVVGIGSVVALEFVDRILNRYSIKKVLTLSLFFYTLPTMLMSRFTHLYQWYIAGLAEGIAGAFILYVPVSTMINAWFIEKKGMAQGIAAAFSGLSGMVMNLVLSSVIKSYGWRTAYLAKGILAFLLALPFTALIVIRRPEDTGLFPLGHSEKDGRKEADKAEGIAGNELDRKTIFLVYILAVIITFSTAFAQHFSNYTKSIGEDPHIGARLVSVTMASNVIVKLIFGRIRDKFDTKKTFIVSLLLTIAGFLVFIICFYRTDIAALGAVLLGFANSNLTVIVPLVVADKYGEKYYQHVYAKVTSGTMISTVLVCPLIGLTFDLTKSYRYVFVLGLFSQILCMLLISRIYRRPIFSGMHTGSTE